MLHNTGARDLQGETKVIEFVQPREEKAKNRNLIPVLAMYWVVEEKMETDSSQRS